MVLIVYNPVQIVVCGGCLWLSALGVVWCNTLCNTSHIIVHTNLVVQYSRFLLSVIASQITGVSIVCSAVCSGEDQRNTKALRHCSMLSGIHRSPLDCLHKGAITWKMFPFEDVIMCSGVVNVDLPEYFWFLPIVFCPVSANQPSGNWEMQHVYSLSFNDIEFLYQNQQSKPGRVFYSILYDIRSIRDSNARVPEYFGIFALSYNLK